MKWLPNKYQWLKPEEYEDMEARIGTVMSHTDFISKLRNAGVKCHYRQHINDDKAVLYACNHPRLPAADYQNSLLGSKWLDA